MTHPDSFSCRRSLEVDGHTYHYFSLPEAARSLGDLRQLPISLRVLLENLLRCEDGRSVTAADCRAVVQWLHKRSSEQEIQFRPARVLMQDFTGVPGVVDLAAMRDAMARAGGDPQKINPLSPVDLVIDHSVMVDRFADASAFADNVAIEMQRNHERYAFLRWGQQAFANFRVVPPGTGICHQVNLEYLAQVVWSRDDAGVTLAYPDTLVGTDSHTTMINGLGVLGWGVGGIEAEAVMLGQPLSMLIPEVVGVRLAGKLREGVTATDLVLTVTELLRKRGVVGKFVEFYGPGLDHLPLADRATIANMAPEYGATCGFFPVDAVTLDYLRLSGREPQRIALVEAYCKAQGLWREAGDEPTFSDSLTLDLASVQPSLAGPKRPQDRVALEDIRAQFDLLLDLSGRQAERDTDFLVANAHYGLHHGDVVIAAITSCTNTSNPSVLMAAGLLAKKAVERGLSRKPWVKSSLAPGSKVVTDYLAKADLTAYLDQLGFNLVGYGCTTCIGNSGPLPPAIADCVNANDLIVSSVLSGNRNFEGRVHPQVKANWLASPPLVVAFALAGTTRIDLTREPLGSGSDGQPVYLQDIWPSDAEVAAAVGAVDGAMFLRRYADVFSGDAAWQSIAVGGGATYPWDPASTYVKNPPFFQHIDQPPAALTDIAGARILALFGDSITTDHISPAGSIKPSSPAGLYLQSLGVAPEDFNSYGARRGNHEVMMRGTFANIRIRNEMLGGEEGGNTLHQPSGDKLPIYAAAMRYQAEGVPLVVIAGKEYGTGSSRDWAAKGTSLLGVKAVIAESFERIHRSNLVGMGVLPLQFVPGQNRQSLALNGSERLSIRGLSGGLKPRQKLIAEILRSDGTEERIEVLCRIDTAIELDYFRAGGILHHVLRQLLSS
ncbi:aconitate hydratase AcnA [Pseudomonas sp. MAP12]|uniref:Aconitate hydratase n=1 Tax=Geopseudomonas aromaticivorans TaxID=2849492 RepID=A0ABS6MXF1_9GAMM|nr:aconitate hydratase AcnA [Pseudomonas aromaticivorans]MBV2133001.1 aconitate hydratase AcnA [Pseudomonas aromaticivorans]